METTRMSMVCRICGDVARGMNFDVMTCMSCKAFFRRNALRPPGILRCVRASQCKITKKKRSHCAACRLQKCFLFGMKPELIRSFTQVQTSTSHPLDLLSTDYLTLTSDQWNLLSNIIHAYNEQTTIDPVECMLNEVSTLLPKIRTKPFVAESCLYQCVRSTESLFERLSQLQSLPLNARHALKKKNLYGISVLNALFILRETNAFDNLNFSVSCIRSYGFDFYNRTNVITKQLDSNRILVKLLLFVIAFSSSYSYVTFHIEDTFSTIDDVHIQDQFVILLWKYLIYQYGFRESVLRYSSLIKTLLDILSICAESSRVSYLIKYWIQSQNQQKLEAFFKDQME